MKFLACLFSLAAFAACLVAPPAGSAGPTAPAPAPAQPGPAPAPTPPAIPMAAFGVSCANAAPCAAGLTCATYYGIAGAQGPAFQSCEMACERGQACPAGTTCVTIADGPGSVCRPAQ